MKKKTFSLLGAFFIIGTLILVFSSKTQAKQIEDEKEGVLYSNEQGTRYCCDFSDPVK